MVMALGAGALTVPLASFAQRAKVWRVGFLSSSVRPASLDSSNIAAFANGMRDLGYVEGKKPDD